MKFISLFSGIGGFDLAFENAGTESVAVCEIDKHAQAVLRRHFPHSELYTDVRDIGVKTHAPKTIDLICGGFPCQDLSIAGKRRGLAGDRSGLWFEFARIIDELEPSWVVIENVPGLLSSNKGRDLAVILSWLGNRGYWWSYRVLDSQYFGVPQRRRRVFIVASFGNGRCAEVLFEREGSTGNFAPSRETREADPRTFVINLANGGANQNNVKATDTVDTWATQAVAFNHKANASRNMPVGKDVTPTLETGHNSMAVAFQPGNLVRGIGARPNDKTFPTLQVDSQGDQFPHVSYVMAHGQANAEIVKDGSPSLTRNHEAPIVWHNKQSAGEIRIQKDISPTVSRVWGTGGNNVPFVGVRRLTPTECERLQGFPDGWTDGQSDTQRYKQLGNAVSIPPVEWIGRRIINIETGDNA